MNSQTQYNVVFPLAKRDQYEANETVDFVISLANKKLVPNSLVITGDCAVFKTKASTPAGSTAPNAEDQLLIDPDSAYHSLFRDFTSEFRDVGLAESFSYYPRYVKMLHQSLVYRDSLGTETNNSIEGVSPSEVVRQGYNLGVNSSSFNGLSGGQFIPFALKPKIAPNKSDVAIPGDQVGTLRIRTRLAPDDEFVYGAQATADSGYFIKNLQIRYETIDDDGTRPPINMEVYNINRQVIETNQANLSTFVPGLSDAVHISFNTVADEGSVTENFLECKTLPGKALGASNDSNNGPERLFYSVNDTQTSLVGFTMESRSEVVYNYLRSWNIEPKAYVQTQRSLNQGETFGIGLPFGSLLDFSNKKFAVDIDSEVTSAHSVYLYFKGMVTLGQ